MNFIIPNLSNLWYTMYKKNKDATRGGLGDIFGV